MNEDWSSYRGHWYIMLVSRHKPLWEFFEKFVSKFNIKSLIDVGGGYGYASKFVNEYVAVEVNQRAVGVMLKKKKFDQTCGIVCGDFTKLDLDAFKEPDAIIIFAVVEHLDSYKPIIEKAISLKPKFVLVSFFNGLGEVEKTIKQTAHSGRKHILKRYAFKDLADFLREQNVLDLSTVFRFAGKAGYHKYTILDTVLVIDFTDAFFRSKLMEFDNVTLNFEEADS